MDIKVHILHDNQRYERLEPLLKELESQGITNYEIIQPEVDVKKFPYENINAAHKSIVRMAKEQGLKECLIFEDDILFTSPNAWKYFLENKPPEYDLYLWGSYIAPLSNNRICGFQAYFISEKFYDRYLSVGDKLHIDTAMDDLKGDYYFCYPFPILQRAGLSANNTGGIVNYNAILKEEDIYRG